MLEADCFLGRLSQWVAGTIVNDMPSDAEKLPSVCMVQYEHDEQEYLDLWWASLRWL